MNDKLKVLNFYSIIISYNFNYNLYLYIKFIYDSL